MKFLVLIIALVTDPVLAYAQDVAAHAEAPPVLRQGFSGGAQLGVIFPSGDITRKVKISDSYNSAVGLSLAAGYRFLPEHYLGAYFTYASLVALCRNDVFGAVTVTHPICEASTKHLGIEYTRSAILPNGVFWFGVGLGYERLDEFVDSINTIGGQVQSRYSAESRTTGYEGRLGAGYDFNLDEGVFLGPLLQFSIGRYDYVESKISGDINQKASEPIPGDKLAMHEWLQLGVRLRFN